MRQPIDWQLCLVIDAALCAPRTVLEVVQAAVQGGVSVVQLRDKQAPTRELIAQARSLKAWLAPRGVPLLVNDRVDVAWAAGADGVHVGQSDMSAAMARAWLGSNAWIGLSVETWEQAVTAEHEPVDYIGISPVFATPTKPDAGAPWGLEGLRRIRSQTEKVLIGIGGIDATNACAVRQAGATGIAVVSAVCAAADPAHAAQLLRKAMHGCTSFKTNNKD